MSATQLETMLQTVLLVTGIVEIPIEDLRSEFDRGIGVITGLTDDGDLDSLVSPLNEMTVRQMLAKPNWQQDAECVTSLATGFLYSIIAKFAQEAGLDMPNMSDEEVAPISSVMAVRIEELVESVLGRTPDVSELTIAASPTIH